MVSKNVCRKDTFIFTISVFRLFFSLFIYVISVPFISGIKAVISKISGLQLGEPRLPIRKLTEVKLEQLEKELKEKKWI